MDRNMDRNIPHRGDNQFTAEGEGNKSGFHYERHEDLKFTALKLYHSFEI